MEDGFCLEAYPLYTQIQVVGSDPSNEGLSWTQLRYQSVGSRLTRHHSLSPALDKENPRQSNKLSGNSELAFFRKIHVFGLLLSNDGLVAVPLLGFLMKND